MDFNEEVMNIWNQVLQENRDVFVTDKDKIFFAIKIVFQCRYVSQKEGLLALEEFVEQGCGMERSEVPLWEYLRLIVWLHVEEYQRQPAQMLTLYRVLDYNGIQAVVACVYLISGVLFFLANRGNSELLNFFRALLPMKERKAFDEYFADCQPEQKELVIDGFRGRYDFLSNFYEAPVAYKGITYENNEAAFQAQKISDEDERRTFCIMEPLEAMRKGRHVKLREDVDWSSEKFVYMYEICREKFSQNEYLKYLLLSTGNTYLQNSNNWEDKIWGTVNGEGENGLEKILMKVREELRGNNLSTGDTYLEDGDNWEDKIWEIVNEEENRLEMLRNVRELRDSNCETEEET